jgi:hypothetical protein
VLGLNNSPLQFCDIVNQFCEAKDVVIDDVTCKATSEFVCTKGAADRGVWAQGHRLPARPQEELLQDTEDGTCHEDAKYDHFNMFLPRSGRRTASPPPNGSARSSPTPSRSRWRS